MRSKSNIIILLVALLAFVPVLASGFLLDSYVRARETPLLMHGASGISSEAQTAVYEALQILDDVVSISPSLCTSSFVNTLSALMQQGVFVRQVLGETSLGVRYCEALGGNLDYEVLSEELPIPGRAETVSAVKIPGVEVPGLRVTKPLDRNKQITAFVTFGHILKSDRLQAGMQNASMLRISFTDGTELLSIGDPSTLEVSNGGKSHISAIAFAGDVPLRVEVAVPFETIKGAYADLYVALIVLACLLTAGVLIGAIRIVRLSQLPSFNLADAIAKGEIRPFYQPVMDITTGKVYGCEVLARWVKSDGEIISPAVFIEYAEVSGLAVPMTISLMESVRADLGEISKLNPDLKISINLFEGHFRDGGVIDDVMTIFSNSQISYRQLVFEITERFPLKDNRQANKVIAGLQALGCKIALDDVGTGHSNLAYVQNLGVDIIKIDRVFIEPITEETKSAPILDGLINMAHHLEAGLIAEGIETEAQAVYLRSKGVKNVQGFLFSPAIKPKNYVDMVLALNNREPAYASVKEADGTNTNLFAA
ncbi:MAG: EAL domain-containing protein [Devosiaceae bacterium]|nr:EAL domain-containing protein [Devosiaceae bacterium]